MTEIVYCKRCYKILMIYSIKILNKDDNSTLLDEEILGNRQKCNINIITDDEYAKRRNRTIDELEKRLAEDDELTDEEFDKLYAEKQKEFDDRFEYQNWLIEKYGEKKGMEIINKLFLKSKGKRK